MQPNKLLSALGLCRRAGKLVMGHDAVADAAARGELSLVVLAADLSVKSADSIRRIMQRHHIALQAATVDMDDVATVTGKRSGILGIADPNLAKAVENALDSLT